MQDTKVIREATFDPKVCQYWLMAGVIALTLFLVTIPLLLLWIPFGLLVTRRFLAAMSCQLTPKALVVRKGVFTRTEKTIPLENITDLGVVQGPLMRVFGLKALSVETAGQSSEGALVSLVGVENTEAFREAVLSQRDAIAEQGGNSPIQDLPDRDALLTEIRDSLLRIETILQDQPEQSSGAPARD